MNSITAIGRLGKDSTTRQAGQSNVVGFTMAVETTRKDDQGKYIADWYRVDVWGKLGESIAQYLLKGTQVCVIGRLEMQTYTDQQGQVKTQPTINAQQVKLLSRPPQQAAAGATPARPTGAATPNQQRPASPPVAAPTKQDWDNLFDSDAEIPF